MVVDVAIELTVLIPPPLLFRARKKSSTVTTIISIASTTNITFLILEERRGLLITAGLLDSRAKPPRHVKSLLFERNVRSSSSTRVTATLRIYVVVGFSVLPLCYSHSRRMT